LVGYITGCSQQDTNPTLDEKRLAANVGFYMKSNLSGTILQSSDLGNLNDTMTFIDLDTNTPRIYFPDTGMTATYDKVFESDSTLTLLLISNTGSVESFMIDKKTGKFSMITAGSSSVLIVQASLGVCK